MQLVQILTCRQTNTGLNRIARFRVEGCKPGFGYELPLA